VINKHFTLAYVTPVIRDGNSAFRNSAFRKVHSVNVL